MLADFLKTSQAHTPINEKTGRRGFDGKSLWVPQGVRSQHVRWSYPTTASVVFGIRHQDLSRFVMDEADPVTRHQDLFRLMKCLVTCPSHLHRKYCTPSRRSGILSSTRFSQNRIERDPGNSGQGASYHRRDTWLGPASPRRNRNGHPIRRSKGWAIRCVWARRTLETN